MYKRLKVVIMEIYLIITIVGVVLMSVVGFFVGRNINRENVTRLEGNVGELKGVISSQEETMRQQNEQIRDLSTRAAEQEANYNNAREQLTLMTEREQSLRDEQERQLAERKEEYEKQIEALKTSFREQLERQRQDNEQQLRAAKEVADKQIENLQKINKEQMDLGSLIGIALNL